MLNSSTSCSSLLIQNLRLSRVSSPLRDAPAALGEALRGALAVAAAVLIIGGNASAHEPKPGPHGGLQVDAGDRHHLELLTRGTEVNVFILDADEKPLPAAGHAGTAILMIAGTPQRVTLSYADGSRLTGTANQALPERPKGAVRVTGPDGVSFQAKFE